MKNNTLNDVDGYYPWQKTSAYNIDQKTFNSLVDKEEIPFLEELYFNLKKGYNTEDSDRIYYMMKIIQARIDKLIIELE